MEAILKILKQLTTVGGQLGSIPKPIKFALLYFSAVVGIFVIFKYTHLDQSTKIFLIIALVLLALITGGYYAWKAWKEKKSDQGMRRGLGQDSLATPRGISDPNAHARLDDLRKKFQSGVEAYKSRGKSIYSLPWYVVVGEPGSGKTEAIRHSNVGFPPGMQDEFQGVGGTINMNWWFTNHAVLLDTAGRLMFEDIKPGETSEWEQFLMLLKKNRPNCPINGLFLVIPADSLIKDTADKIQEKAGKIAKQLDVIQRKLDVRFPVFVAVTKCDKINGFREFFDGLNDPQLQHQMMGWSNPDPLDEPFKAEKVDNHLEQVAERLRRRRLGLMRDPVPENPEGRRTDELDSLYALPHSLELLGSRLRRYLETIFIAGEWSAKPLFLRGIYFSSSMREGSALDAELAEAFGVSVDDLPEGKVWERERAFFLRDLFIEKVFREKGLVTRATDTRSMLRTQKILLYGFGFASLAIFSVLAWFAMGSLRGGVKDQGDYWHLVSSGGWDNKYWKQSLVPMRGDGSFASAISTNVLVVDNKPVTLGEFHVKLQDLAEKPLKKNFMFPGLADKYNQNSHRAQRIVFEGGVVRPLLDAARQKMSRDEGDPASAQRQPDALAALIQLEADILSRGTGTNTGTLSPDGTRKFLASLENYIAGTDVTPDTNLVAVMSWTYSTNETSKGSWPPRWLSGGRGGTNSLAINSGISAGLELFVRNATNGIQTYLSDWKQISTVRDAAHKFADAERALFAAASSSEDARFSEALRALDAARKSLDDYVAKASSNPLYAEGVMLANAQQKFRAGVMSSAGAALGRVREVNDAALAANKDYPLFREIKTRLDAVQASLSSRVEELLKSGDPKEFQQLDDACLAGKAFVARADLYDRADKLASEKPFAGGNLVGLKGEQLQKFLDDGIGAVRTEAAAYTGKLTNEFERTIAYQLKRAEKAQGDAFFAAYIGEASGKLSQSTGFPLVRDLNSKTTEESFKKACTQLKYISDDLAGPVFQKFPAKDRSDDWKRFISSVQGQQAVARVLLGEEGILGACTVSLADQTDTPKDKWRATWRNMKLVCDGCNSDTIRTGDSGDQKMGEAPIQQKIELRLIRNTAEGASSQTFPIQAPEWGALWLIHKYKGDRDKLDPKTWLVELPLTAPDTSGSLRLKLKFDGVLPELDKWPAL